MFLWIATVLLQSQVYLASTERYTVNRVSFRNAIHQQINFVKDQFRHFLIESKQTKTLKRDSFQRLWHDLEISLADFDPKLNHFKQPIEPLEKIKIIKWLEPKWMDHVKSSATKWIIKSLIPWMHRSGLSADQFKLGHLSIQKMPNAMSQYGKMYLNFVKPVFF